MELKPNIPWVSKNLRLARLGNLGKPNTTVLLKKHRNKSTPKKQSALLRDQCLAQSPTQKILPAARHAKTEKPWNTQH